MEGIDSAFNAGLEPIKINSVTIRGYNDDEIIDLVNFARERNATIKFIEFMPLDGLGIWSPDKMISGKEVLRIISEYYNIIPKGREPGTYNNLEL